MLRNTTIIVLYCTVFCFILFFTSYYIFSTLPLFYFTHYFTLLLALQNFFWMIIFLHRPIMWLVKLSGSISFLMLSYLKSYTQKLRLVKAEVEFRIKHSIDSVIRYLHLISVISFNFEAFLINIIIEYCLNYYHLKVHYLITAIYSLEQELQLPNW